MMKNSLIGLCLALVLLLAIGFMIKSFLDQNQSPDDKLEELKEPHYFTSYLDKNDLEGARLEGRVDLEREGVLGVKGAGDFTSYAGFFNVNKDCNSNLYSWFFQNKNTSAPVILWLQGGPGAPSLFGLFTEIGPYFIDQDLNLNYRPHAWTDDYSILFVDSPVGTGFSYTERDECWARTQTDVSNDLFNLLIQFFTVFPELKTNDFYIVGESYGGKYVPYLAYTIHQRKETAQKYFNFVGIAVGDAWTDPVNQLGYSDLLYQIGLLDAKQQAEMKALEEEAIDLINKKEWLKAFEAQNKLVCGDLGVTSMLTNFTGMTYMNNFLNAEEPAAHRYWKQFVQQDKVRNLINVGNRTLNDGIEVLTLMREDYVMSIVDELVVVMDNYKVMLYNGQLDIICAPVLTQNFLSKLNWKGVNSYLDAPKIIWKVDQDDLEIAGYVKSVVESPDHQFHYVAVRNAGHILPYDAPREAQDLIRRFINNQLPQPQKGDSLVGGL